MKKGFTMVEILMVIAIIGLLSAIAIPNFVTAKNTIEVIERTGADNKSAHEALKEAKGDVDKAVTLLKGHTFNKETNKIEIPSVIMCSRCQHTMRRGEDY